LLISTVAFADQKPADPSDKVTLSSFPQSPMVIDAILELSTGQTILPPWLIHHVAIDNQAADAVTISSIQYFVQDNATGNIQETFALPADYDYSITCQGDGIGYTKHITYTDFGTYAANYSGPLMLTYKGDRPKECPAVDPKEPIFYRGQLGPEGHHDYNVRVTYQGWFGPQDQPAGRFEKTITFVSK